MIRIYGADAKRANISPENKRTDPVLHSRCLPSADREPSMIPVSHRKRDLRIEQARIAL